ncbi:MAG: ABC transporter ATP-binding protein, partial [Polyangiaceae bacterium]
SVFGDETAEDRVIEALDLQLAYGANVVLDGVTMRLCAGELLAIIGPNGIGKSTLLRAFGGLHVPASGEVIVDGVPIREMSGQSRARRIGLIEVEGAPIANVVVREAVSMGRLPHRPWWRWAPLAEDDAIVDAALERTQLLERSDRLLDALSSGERQRVWVALALAQEAPNLLFDEPTSHLDLRHATSILSLLRALADDGAAVAIVVHDLNLAAAHADRIALLGEGTLLACDAPERVFEEALLSRAYGVPIVVKQEEDRLLAFAAVPGRRTRRFETL